MSIGKNIRELRKLKGLTQKQLAEKAGLAVITIQGYEAGKYEPKIDTLHKIAKALDKSIILLVAGCEDKYPLTDEDYKIDLANATEPEKRIIQMITSEDEKYFYTPAMSEASKNIRKKGYKLLEHFQKLNEIGQEKAIEHVEMLTKIPEYRKDEE